MRPLRSRIMGGVGVFSVLFTLMLWLPTVSWSARLPENPMEGLSLFIDKGCVNCHSILGYGKKVAPDLAKLHLRGSFLGLAAILWNHLPRMDRAFSQLNVQSTELTEDETFRIMALIYSLNIFDRSGDVARGNALFDQKGCRRCHSVNEKGGHVGPTLDKFGGAVSLAFLTSAFWDRGFPMARSIRAMGMKWPKFNADEMADIAAYVRSEGKASDRPRNYLRPPNPKAGESLFASKGCVQCHNVLGKGGKLGPNLGRRDRQRSMAQLAGLVWNHGPRMWETIASRNLVVRLNPQEMADLLGYIYFIQYVDAPADIETGRKVFEFKGCADCHRTKKEVKARGIGVGPDLGTRKLDTDAKVVAAMWNHGPRMGKQARELGMTWPSMSSGEMVDLVGYIRSLQ